MKCQVVSALYTILFVEFALTSTNIEGENSVQRLKESTELATYCDPKYYVSNITAADAEEQCAYKCSFLQGYVTSQNQLVCFRWISAARRISKSNDGLCVCGHKRTKGENRQRCFPPLEINLPANYEACDRECSKHTVLRSKKLDERNTRDIMWCGEEWNQNNVIKRMDSIAKVVGHIAIEKLIVPTVVCYCGSKWRKANTFLSEETTLKMEEERRVAQATERLELNELVVSCSFKKFRVNTKSKCRSVCTKTKAFFTLDTRELICYANTTTSSRIVSKVEGAEIENQNICECGVKFGRNLKKIQPCIPPIREENTLNLSIGRFIYYCQRKCPSYDVYMASDPKMYGVEFCELRSNPSPKISVNLDFKCEVSENDEQFFGCECGLTELSLMKYQIQNTNEIRNLSRNVNSRDQGESSSHAANYTTRLSQTECPNQLAGLPKTIALGGMTNAIACSSQTTLHAGRSNESLVQSNRARCLQMGEEFQIASSVGREDLEDLPQVASHHATSFESGSAGTHIAGSPRGIVPSRNKIATSNSSQAVSTSSIQQNPSIKRCRDVIENDFAEPVEDMAIPTIVCHHASGINKESFGESRYPLPDLNIPLDDSAISIFSQQPSIAPEFEYQNYLPPKKRINNVFKESS